MPHALIALLLTLASGLARAQATPAGLWRTIDDDGRTEKSWVRITEAHGTLTGRVEKIADPAKAGATCDKCSDARKDQPVLGMVILRDVKPDPGEPGLWRGGDILDPNNGKTYKVHMKPIDGGKKLELRGYIGMPLLGRTQTWIRVE